MIELIRDILGWIFIGGGAVFVVLGAIGIFRFPDFYARIHAAGVTDTMGVELMLVGFAVQADNWQTIAKLFFIALFLLLTGPVATHALAHAAWIGGLNPILGKDLKRRDVTPGGEDDFMAQHQDQKQRKKEEEA